MSQPGASKRIDTTCIIPEPRCLVNEKPAYSEEFNIYNALKMRDTSSGGYSLSFQMRGPCTIRRQIDERSAKTPACIHPLHCGGRFYSMTSSSSGNLSTGDVSSYIHPVEASEPGEDIASSASSNNSGGRVICTAGSANMGSGSSPPSAPVNRPISPRTADMPMTKSSAITNRSRNKVILFFIAQTTYLRMYSGTSSSEMLMESTKLQLCASDNQANFSKKFSISIS